MKLKKMLAPWKKTYDKPRQHIKNRDITLPTEVCIVKIMVFPVVMYGCESWTTEAWVHKNLWFRTVVLKKTLESPLNNKIKPSPKGNQPWIFIGRAGAEAEAPILWPPDVKSWLTGIDRPWYWERLRAGGEAGDRGWDGWMASMTQWTWMWANSGR